MKKQGKILRDPKIGPGLLIVEGQQFPLPPPGPWRSDLPPTRGMSVEVEFGTEGDILKIRPIAESQGAKGEGTALRLFSKLFASMRSRKGSGNSDTEFEGKNVRKAL